MSAESIQKFLSEDLAEIRACTTPTETKAKTVTADVVHLHLGTYVEAKGEFEAHQALSDALRNFAENLYREGYLKMTVSVRPESPTPVMSLWLDVAIAVHP